MTTTGRAARIAQLRESIARRALTAAGVPDDARILNVRRVGTVFVVATEEPTNRWATYYVETFRIPTPDDTDRDYEPGEAPKIWCPLAGWSGDSPDEVPAMLAKATAYARTA
ncbi:hypothetical protein [Streptomyces flaveolus]|uniref:hypothetical protein n=1 Tax=Streptomyces flaveolus TaxID=67297 RepID=UPI0004C221EF|nr:hypothetical protein [Streptomyces flaveolus]GGQ83748.1 hypothetical protein GCM10010216_52020 [Streptomyces flaveolus]